LVEGCEAAAMRAGQLRQVGISYGYALGTPEENAAVGIETPKFAAD
jgi:hypothetical protein